jgi:hypothetical protein
MNHQARGKGRLIIAIALSVLLHAGGLWFCAALPWREGRTSGGAFDVSDTRNPDARMEVTLDLFETAPQAQASTAKSKEPSPPEQSILAPRAPATALAAATPTVGARKSDAGEEQNDPANSNHPAGGNPGTGKGTAPAGPSLFAIATQAASVVYVIDHSASMGLHGSFEIAKRELLASLERLPAQTRFQVVVYNRTAEPVHLDSGAALAQASPEHKQCVATFLEALRAEGGTDHANALKRALALQPEVIFFLTDADDLKLAQIQAVTHLNRGRTIIHTIELRSGTQTSEESSLEILARANRGVSRLVSLPK